MHSQNFCHRMSSTISSSLGERHNKMSETQNVPAQMSQSLLPPVQYQTFQPQKTQDSGSGSGTAGIRIDPPDPYWECESGPGSRTQELDQNWQINLRILAFQKGFYKQLPTNKVNVSCKNSTFSDGKSYQDPDPYWDKKLDPDLYCIEANAGSQHCKKSHL